jgi:hypothetical protein
MQKDLAKKFDLAMKKLEWSNGGLNKDEKSKVLLEKGKLAIV